MCCKSHEPQVPWRDATMKRGHIETGYHHQPHLQGPVLRIGCSCWLAVFAVLTYSKDVFIVGTEQKNRGACDKVNRKEHWQFTTAPLNIFSEHVHLRKPTWQWTNNYIISIMRNPFFRKHKKHMDQGSIIAILVSRVSSVYPCFLFSPRTRARDFPKWWRVRQPKELRHVNFQPSRPWSQSNVGCNEARSASVVVNLTLVEAVLKRGKKPLIYRDFCTKKSNTQSIYICYIITCWWLQPTPFWKNMR